MDPIIWAAIIAENMWRSPATSRPTLFRASAETHNASKSRRRPAWKWPKSPPTPNASERNGARRHARERGKLYGDALAAIIRLEHYARGPDAPTDEAFEQANRDYELLHQRMLLEGAEDVQNAVGAVTDALYDIGENMHRFGGRSAESFRAAYNENARGDAVTDARARLIRAMREDVTAPHLPERRDT